MRKPKKARYRVRGKVAIRSTGEIVTIAGKKMLGSGWSYTPKNLGALWSEYELRPLTKKEQRMK